MSTTRINVDAVERIRSIAGEERKEEAEFLIDLICDEAKEGGMSRWREQYRKRLNAHVADKGVARAD